MPGSVPVLVAILVDIRYLRCLPRFLVERKAIRSAAPSVRSGDAMGPRVARRGRGASVWWGGVGEGVETGALYSGIFFSAQDPAEGRGALFCFVEIGNYF